MAASGEGQGCVRATRYFLLLLSRQRTAATKIRLMSCILQMR